MVLFSDATILTETPPLRACWSPVGQQAEVPVTGNRSKKVVFGALNPGTGTLGEPALMGIGLSPRRFDAIGQPVSVCHQLSMTGTPRTSVAHL